MSIKIVTDYGRPGVIDTGAARIRSIAACRNETPRRFSAIWVGWALTPNSTSAVRQSSPQPNDATGASNTHRVAGW